MLMAHGCAGSGMITILILAAGNSSRMRGRDKLMEDVDGMPLLRRTVMRAQATGSAVIVTLPAFPHPRYGALDGLDVERISVPDAGDGINASLRRGLGAVPKAADAAMVLLADMPDVTTEDIMTVLESVSFDTNTLIWRATTQSGAAGHPIVFHKSLLPPLIALEGDHGGNAVVKAHAQSTVYIALPEQHARIDLDTPEDWAAWREKNSIN